MPNIVQCEKHGLRYNADIQDGCVICRREAGGRPAPGAGTAPATASRSVAASGGGAMAPALAVTAVLLLGTTGVFYVTHSLLARALRTILPPDGAELYDAGQAPGGDPFAAEEYGQESTQEDSEDEEYLGDEYDYE